MTFEGQITVTIKVCIKSYMTFQCTFHGDGRDKEFPECLLNKFVRATSMLISHVSICQLMNFLVVYFLFVESFKLTLQQDT